MGRCSGMGPGVRIRFRVSPVKKTSPCLFVAAHILPSDNTTASFKSNLRYHIPEHTRVYTHASTAQTEAGKGWTPP